MYDLIIVGGGLRDLLLEEQPEKQEFQLFCSKKKIFRGISCGGALSPYALSCLDFELPEYLIERDISKVRIHFRELCTERQKDYRLALLVSRTAFDNFLLDKARETGIDIHLGEKVLNCEEREGCVEVKTSQNTYLAKFVLIAEGSEGTLKHNVRRHRDRRTEYDLALVSEVPEKDEVISSRFPDLIDIRFGITPGGYGWIFPHQGYYSVGVVGTAEYLEHPKEIMQAFLQTNGFSGDYQIHSHIIPVGGIKRKTVSSRILLSGDAAGFADAFLGEGIAYAVRSGQLAAEKVAELVLYDQRLGDLKEYEARCRQEFGNFLVSSLKLEKVMHRFPETSFRLALSRKEILDKYLDEVMINRSHKDYVRWLLLNFSLSEPASKMRSITEKNQ
ncbi:geranylgeranyl reductase family protein [Methanosarcina horonobensis]|uniref:geranylgeranyl reductase family protein n=1 Tax=Methanosarcina horonobensis TaxID=418008 RepID=UPI000B217180|nr:geranylgeranyl reductase family protein [Methanosarcina horonobensis]